MPATGCAEKRNDGSARYVARGYTPSEVALKMD